MTLDNGYPPLLADVLNDVKDGDDNDYVGDDEEEEQEEEGKELSSDSLSLCEEYDEASSEYEIPR
jgi:hypothetical protein